MSSGRRLASTILRTAHGRQNNTWYSVKNMHLSSTGPTYKTTSETLRMVASGSRTTLDKLRAMVPCLRLSRLQHINIEIEFRAGQAKLHLGRKGFPQSCIGLAKITQQCGFCLDSGGFLPRDSVGQRYTSDDITHSEAALESSGRRDLGLASDLDPDTLEIV